MSVYDEEFWGDDGLYDEEDRLSWDELEGTDEYWDDYEYYDDGDEEWDAWPHDHCKHAHQRRRAVDSAKSLS